MSTILRKDSAPHEQDNKICTEYVALGVKVYVFNRFGVPFEGAFKLAGLPIHTLMLASSLAETRTENTGWNVTRVTGERWPVSTCRAGARGSQSVCEPERRAGAAESSSWSCALRFSSSMI